MHKNVLKFFNFLKESTEFAKILVLFSVLMFLLYWIENLTSSSWSWNNFIEPVLELFLYLGNLISVRKIEIWGVVFEFKYFYALVSLITVYIFADLVKKFWILIEGLYEDGRQFVRKTEEDIFNKNLEKQMTKEQKKISSYNVYVSTSVKELALKQGLKVDLVEQNKMMNKFVIEKTGVTPKLYQEGFLYTFTNFSNIDNVLQVLFKLLESKAPIDYKICINILNGDSEVDKQDLDFLINLNLKNKIACKADVVYRYGFNETKNYYTTLVGLFGIDSESFEVHEFYSSNV